jgi:hypothetical protein
MITIIAFYLSLFLIGAMLFAKYRGISLFEHKAIAKIVSEEDIHRITGTGKNIASKIHLENAQKLVMRIVAFVKREMIYLKRHFDSKQPKFLLKTEVPNAGKHSVSFFLKHISEHKNSLKKK